LGYFPVYAPDGSGKIHLNGKFCYYTEKAVCDFQRDNKLVVDGIFGPVTKKKLIEKITPALKSSNKKVEKEGVTEN
jgi:peptidoglycan hydrolase-like protein with peptidoglycan-binding domain